MGSHQSHEKQPDGAPSRSRSGSRRLSSPRGSKPDLEKPEKPPPTSMIPVEKLAKMLTQRSQKEDGVNGVTEKSFMKYIFPRYPELARRFFRHLKFAAHCNTPHIPAPMFRAQVEKVLVLLEDELILDTYVRMFGCEEECLVTRDGFLSLLVTCHQLSMDHYPGGPRKCPMVHVTLGAVVSGCFGGKESHSVGFVTRWLSEHCHRLLLPLHRYCVHVLATKHRELESVCATEYGTPTEDGAGAGIELSSPVLDDTTEGGGTALLPVSAACILAAAAPPVYSRPLHPAPVNAGTLASTAWLARIVCAAPSHWTPLYCSREHGLGANRFLHHTLAYRGPTLVVVSAGEDVVVVILAPVEWREHHNYWGNQDTALIQLQPQLCVVERAPKMLYLNLSIRGYPHGLRAGSDPRKPLLIINDGFDSLTFNGVPYPLRSIEVWGCGDVASRENQLEIKKWQVKEAERHREVKLSPADWMEHPDRYLLELAGRPQYNNSSS